MAVPVSKKINPISVIANETPFEKAALISPMNMHLASRRSQAGVLPVSVFKPGNLSWTDPRPLSQRPPDLNLPAFLCP